MDRRLLKWVSEDTGFDELTVRKAVESFWMTVREKIDSFPNDPDDSQFDENRCVNIPMIGKFFTTRSRVRRVKENINNKIKKHNEGII